MNDNTTINVEARVLCQAGGDLVAEVTGGRPDLIGVFAFGDTPSAARRALFDVIAVAATVTGAPAIAPDAVIRITIPEVYQRALGTTPAGA